MSTPSAADIRVALRERFPAGSHALMFEVGNATGFSTRRHADAIAMGLWPSRGMEVEGIEIKVSRGDWQRELCQPDKSAPIQKFCDRWWIAAPKGLIDPAELPKTWGLLELNGKGALRVKVRAPALDAARLDRTFVAAILRRASNVDDAELKTMVDKRVEQATTAIQKRADDEIQRHAREAQAVLAKAAEIKDATGIDLNSWRPSKDIVAAIDFAGRIQHRYPTLAEMAKNADDLAKSIRAFTELESQESSAA